MNRRGLWMWTTPAVPQPRAEPARVLQPGARRGRDPHNPLLERVKFLAILGTNLDEFFMVRVAGLKQQLAAGMVEISPDGLTPAEQLAAVRKSVTRLMIAARDCLLNEILPRLHEAGIHILDYPELNERQLTYVKSYFEEVVFPVLTPLAFDPGRPFPYISNLSLNLAVLIRDPDGKERFARVKVPGTLPHLVPLRRSSGAVTERRHCAPPPLLRLAGARHRRQPGDALPRHADRGGASLPRHPRCRHGHPGAGGLRPAGINGRERPPAAFWLGGAGDGEQGHAGRHPRAAGREPGSGTARCL